MQTPFRRQLPVLLLLVPVLQVLPSPRPRLRLLAILLHSPAGLLRTCIRWPARVLLRLSMCCTLRGHGQPSVLHTEAHFSLAAHLTDQRRLGGGAGGVGIMQGLARGGSHSSSLIIEGPQDDPRFMKEFASDPRFASPAPHSPAGAGSSSSTSRLQHDQEDFELKVAIAMSIGDMKELNQLKEANDTKEGKEQGGKPGSCPGGRLGLHAQPHRRSFPYVLAPVRPPPHPHAIAAQLAKERPERLAKSQRKPEPKAEAPAPAQAQTSDQSSQLSAASVVASGDSPAAAAPAAGQESKANEIEDPDDDDDEVASAVRASRALQGPGRGHEADPEAAAESESELRPASPRYDEKFLSSSYFMPAAESLSQLLPGRSRRRRTPRKPAASAAALAVPASPLATPPSGAATSPASAAATSAFSALHTPPSGPGAGVAAGPLGFPAVGVSPPQQTAGASSGSGAGPGRGVSAAAAAATAAIRAGRRGARQAVSVHSPAGSESGSGPPPLAAAGELLTSQFSAPTPLGKTPPNYNEASAAAENEHSQQHLTLLSVEVFAHSRGTLLSDPSLDPVCAIVYAVRDQVYVPMPCLVHCPCPVLSDA